MATPCPIFDFTNPTSPLLRLPSTVTSVRKLVLIDRLARGRFGLRDIVGVDRSIGGGVANQKTHRRRNVAGVVLRIERVIPAQS